MIEMIGGEGTIEKRIPAMLRMFDELRHRHPQRADPRLPDAPLPERRSATSTSTASTTDVENLYVAGEAVGGIHGRNRLMGNSLLDIIVFGRSAGQHAAEKSKETTVGKLTLDHIAKFDKEREEAGVITDLVSPKLLPNYVRKESETR